MVDKVPMTQNGFVKLNEEHRWRQQDERPRIIEAIAEARAHGDLSENAEYHAAKEAQALNEGRIQELESLIGRADIIDVSKLAGDHLGDERPASDDLDHVDRCVVRQLLDDAAVGEVLAQAPAFCRFSDLADALVAAPLHGRADLVVRHGAGEMSLRLPEPKRDGKADFLRRKHSSGGMMDAEFAVQYLVLAHACEVPALRDNAGNIALLKRAEAAGLLPAGVGSAAADAYRELRRAQHRARLDEQPTQFPPDVLTTERE
eukprot:gene39970-54045_t